MNRAITAVASDKKEINHSVVSLLESITFHITYNAFFAHRWQRSDQKLIIWPASLAGEMERILMNNAL